MRNRKFWNRILFFVLTFSLIVGCGDDDGDNNSGISGGVNVVGKKMREVTIFDYTDGKNTDNFNYKFKIDYDEKGRLTDVTLLNYPTYNYVDGELKVVKEEAVNYLKIDYDMRIAHVFTFYNRSTSYMFTLNNKGYIAQIGPKTCTYDENGYLIGVESSSELWSFGYREGELIKSAVSLLARGNTNLYYFYPGENASSGEMYFRMTTPKEYAGIRNLNLSFMLFVAYQAGLFGKVSKFCSNLSRTEQSKAVFSKTSEKSENEIKIRCTFKY